MTPAALSFVVPLVAAPPSSRRHPWRRLALRAIEANVASAALLTMVLVLMTGPATQGPLRSMLFACAIASGFTCAAAERARRLAPTLVSRGSSTVLHGAALSQSALAALALALS